MKCYFFTSILCFAFVCHPTPSKATKKQKQVQQLLKKLQSPVLREREQASFSLALSQDMPVIPSALPLLSKALKDKNEHTRSNIASYLLSYGRQPRYAKQVLQVLLPLLQDKSWQVRRNVFATLGKMKLLAKAAIPSLVKGLQHKDPRTQKAASVAIARIGLQNKLYIPQLYQSYQHKDPEVKQNIIYTFANMTTRSPKMMGFFAKALRSSHTQLRINASVALQRSNPFPKTYLPIVFSSLSDSSEAVQVNLLTLLLRVGKPAFPVTPKLLHLLKTSTSWKVKLRAARILGTFSSSKKEILQALLIALKDKHHSVRQHTAFALSQIPDSSKQVIDALIHAQKDQNYKVVFNAVQALGKRKKKAALAVPSILTSLKHPHIKVRLQSAISLGQICSQPRKSIKGLLAALRDEKIRVRQFSLWALGRFQSHSKLIIPTLLQTLSQTKIASRALGAIKELTPKAQKVLTKLQQYCKANTTPSKLRKQCRKTYQFLLKNK